MQPLHIRTCIHAFDSSPCNTSHVHHCYYFAFICIIDALKQFVEEEGITDNEDIQYLNLVLDAGENEFAGENTV